jgi:hypothetical protein
MDDRYPVSGFEEAYAAGRAGETYELKPKATSNVGHGTLDDLRIRYCAAIEVEVKTGAISTLTLSGRQRALEQACNVKKGEHRLGALKAERPIEASTCILDSYGTLSGAAEQAMKALKDAYKWGATRGFPEPSSVLHVSTPHTGRGGATPWTSEDEKAFLDRHRPGPMARLWFWLAKNMAGRIGDKFDIGPVLHPRPR